MEQSQIEHHFYNGKYQLALDGLSNIQASAWADTIKLRCMRYMGHADLVPFANQLRAAIAKSSEPYPMNTSERSNQLRYIALVYSGHNRAEDACEIMAQLCKQSPNVAAFHREHAFALTNDSQLDKAESALNRALKLEPDNANSHSQLGHIYCKTGRVNAGYGCYSRAATLEPTNASYIQRLLFWSNYSEFTTQQSNYQLTQLWANRAFPHNQDTLDTWGPDNPNRPLKLAFVSSDFCAHVVSFFITPLLEGLSRSEFHISAYSDTEKNDEVTQSIRARCDRWHDSSCDSDSQLASKISADKIDILVDLNGHTAGNRLGLFAKHVAPLQLSWFGYPSTTGLKSIGYRITDRIADPTGPNDQFFSEKLLRLPNGFLCYKPLETAPEIKPSSRQPHIRFGSFGDLAKVSSLTLDCWAAALHATPKSTLTIKKRQLINNNASKHLLTQLAERGISNERIILQASNSKIEQRLDEYNNIDIALDTTPYNGIATTLEALWMGVPVISLMGQTHVSRISASILYRLNLSGLATSTVTEFAERAKELSELKDTLQELRFSLRKRMKESPLMNNRQFGREFGNTLRSQWRDWCGQRDIEQSVVKPSKKSVTGINE